MEQQLVPIEIPTICWYTMPSNCTYMFSMRKVKASHISAQDQHLYESYFLLLKNPALAEVQRYVFDSLLKHKLTRDNTFAYMSQGSNYCFIVTLVSKIYYKNIYFKQSKQFYMEAGFSHVVCSFWRLTEGDKTKKWLNEISFRRFGDLKNATKRTKDKKKWLQRLCRSIVSRVRWLNEQTTTTKQILKCRRNEIVSCQNGIFFRLREFNYRNFMKIELVDFEQCRLFKDYFPPHASNTYANASSCKTLTVVLCRPHCVSIYLF